MSTARQPLTPDEESFLAVRSFAATLPTGHVIESHSHRWSQLVCATSGAMTVYGGRSSWMVPPGYAIFIPAGSQHSIRMWGDVATRSLYFPAMPINECRVLVVTPLLRELILRIVDWHALDSRVPAHQTLLMLLLDELDRVQADLKSVLPLVLPLPGDPRARAVAQHVLDNLAENESLAKLAPRFGAGRRTLERLFQNDTGLSFGLWRQKARLLGSIRFLAEGRSVTETALDVGYGSLSAYIAAFKKNFGYTPGRS